MFIEYTLTNKAVVIYTTFTLQEQYKISGILSQHFPDVIYFGMNNKRLLMYFNIFLDEVLLVCSNV